MVGSVRFVAFVVGVVSWLPAADAGIALKAVRFPKQLAGTGGKTIPPTAAPLSQAVVFEFSGEPQIAPGVAEGLRIRVAAGPFTGKPAVGSYEVKGNAVVFRPRLPTGNPPPGFGPTTDVAADASLPGLIPATTYTVGVQVGGANAVKNLTKIKSGAGVPLTFTTTGVAAAFFANAPTEPVAVKKKKTSPKSGTKGLHPNLFADPAGLFTKIKAKKRPPFEVVFDGPVSPSPLNYVRNRLRLRAVKTPEGSAVDDVLGATVVLVENAPKRARVLVYPNGVLPLGHTVALELSNRWLALSGAMEAGPSDPEEFETLAKYQVASDPDPGAPLDDFVEEDFDTTARQDTSIAAAGQQLASWDAQNSNVLRASFGFGGDGSLGPFQPPTGQPVTIFLDTDFQALPLFSGATPQAKPGTAVVGGVFHFTDFHLPPNATLIARGSNPLIVTATGDVTIEGRIDLNGGNGLSDNTFDSAMTTMPGGSAGPGGGRGGDGHPVIVPQGAANVTFIQVPAMSGTGAGPFNAPGGGGRGGGNGCTLPWSSFNGGNCANFSGLGDGSRGSGGGGGSFANFLPDAPESKRVSGRAGGFGLGNHVPVPFAPGSTIPPAPQAYQAQPGNPTNAVAMPNPGPTFAQAHAAGMIWDSGTQFNLSTNAAQTKRITMSGAMGPPVFADVNDANDFIGPGGELKTLIGGQGGGGGGTRTEGLDQACKQAIFVNAQLPFTVLDARGGGGGGGGGALMVQALGTIEVRGAKARIEAKGGHGGGGEQIENSDRGGGGGGGSGGAVLLQSATDVVMIDAALQAVVIDVSGGCGANATTLSGNAATGIPNGGDPTALQVGDGGPGGPGLVQIQVPPGVTLQIDSGRINARIYRSVFVVSQANASLECGNGNGLTNFQPLVPPASTPTPYSSQSVARSTWIDLGAAGAAFRPPVVTSAGPIEGPVFGVPGVGPFFQGTDSVTGLVGTDAEGFVVNPFTLDIEVDSPDLAQADYIPNGALDPHFQSVLVRFQGAKESKILAGVPDVGTATAWVADPTLLNGFPFVRWEIRFDIATDPELPPQPSTPRPQVNRFRLPFRF